MTDLYEGESITIWSDKFEDSDEVMITLRIGMTTIQMPKSVFMELHAGITKAFLEVNAEKLT